MPLKNRGNVNGIYMRRGGKNNMIPLETDRLLIREFNHDDTQLVMQYSQEACKRKELPDEVFETFDDAVRQIHMCMRNYAEKKYPLVYAIVLKETNVLIGDILLCPIKEGIEIGYSIAENYQGNGYATEAIISFVHWSKDFLNLPMVYGLAKKSNIASWRALEKAGFTFLHEKEINFFGGVFPFKVYAQ